MTDFKLLLVDDEKAFIEILAQRLHQRGFQAGCVFSGAEALKQLKNDSSVDVVVMDIKMPGLDGMDTLLELKRRHPLVEVIMLTGHSTIPTAIDAIKLGAFDYLIKPCDIHQLISRATQAVSRKRERERKIFDARIKPFITREERDELIARILDG